MTTLSPSLTWTPICPQGALLPDAGVCALLGDKQVAVFLVAGQLYAVGNRDPYTGANVISRGLTGSYTRGGIERPKVASPLLKHTFDLETGEALGDPAVRLPVYPVRLTGGEVWIGLAV